MLNGFLHRPPEQSLRIAAALAKTAARVFLSWPTVSVWECIIPATVDAIRPVHVLSRMVSVMGIFRQSSLPNYNLAVVTKAIWTRALSIISGALACLCFYIGPTTLLFLPPGNEDVYWDSGRVVYGVLPTILGAGLVVLAGWLWSRGDGRASLVRYLGNAFSAVVGALVLFWVVLIVIAHIRS